MVNCRIEDLICNRIVVIAKAFYSRLTIHHSRFALLQGW